MKYKQSLNSPRDAGKATKNIDVSLYYGDSGTF